MGGPTLPCKDDTVEYPRGKFTKITPWNVLCACGGGMYYNIICWLPLFISIPLICVVPYAYVRERVGKVVHFLYTETFWALFLCFWSLLHKSGHPLYPVLTVNMLYVCYTRLTSGFLFLFFPDIFQIIITFSRAATGRTRVVV